MPALHWLADDKAPFPPTASAWGEDTDAPGLLAAGGGLSVPRLRQAYAQGIYPWYGPGQPILWWTPTPRMVLPVARFRLHRSLRKVITRFLGTPGCEIRFDHDFPAVIQACAGTPRAGQEGTWIVPEMVRAYQGLHRAGSAHSVETWVDGQLCGGLYGILIGRMFFGESMFAHRTDASKIALAALVAHCRGWAIPWIDCQQQTQHLASLGAAPVERRLFEAHLQAMVGQAPPHWTYDPACWNHLLPERPAAPAPVALP